MSAPDPFLIDQSRAILMQLEGISMPSSCHNRYIDNFTIYKVNEFTFREGNSGKIILPLF